MRSIDITQPLGPRTAVYPGDPPVTLEPLSVADGGEGFAVARLSMGSHAGTHIDSPAHVIPGGTTVDALPLDVLIGPALLVDLADGAEVSAAAVAATATAERLLLRTGGAPLSEAAARALVAGGVRLVGVDGLSVAPQDRPAPVHRLLLDAGVIVVEGLALAGVAPGWYTLLCLPLRLEGGDGAPVRAVLIADAGQGGALTGAMASSPPAGLCCVTCARRLTAGYRLRDGEVRCLRHALRHRGLLRRSLLTALIVGTLLTAINQGDRLVHTGLSSGMLLKMALTYSVPFAVSTTGGLGAMRMTAAADERR